VVSAPPVTKVLPSGATAKLSVRDGASTVCTTCFFRL